MQQDFSLGKYADLCNSIKNYNIFTVKKYLDERPKNNFIILRHDVDRKSGNALKMAKLENDLNIISTYYFRVNNKINIDTIKQIKNLNHEIGYHYEVLSKSNGDLINAIKIFENELKYLRNICEIETICMHGSPISMYKNTDIWEKYDFRKYNIKGDALLSINNINYMTDTGRNWNNENNIRDKIKTNLNNIKIKNTNELINLINNNHNNYYFSIHPERWSIDNIDWVGNYMRDFTFNLGKKFLKIYYKNVYNNDY